MELTRYRSIVADNARWEGFVFRDGDIIISTPPKCGTTWTQTICALLIFGTPDFPKALDLVSPWLEQSLRDRASVVADLEAQEHRRFIKSHTPMDGIPFDERVTYICVGRDPRDVALSWDNHMANLDFGAFFTLRDKAVGNDDLAELMPEGPPVPAATELERFWEWVDSESAEEQRLAGLADTLHHLETFWRQRTRPNVVMLHYGDLKADLEGQMRALADRLGIDVAEDAWPELVEAATFESMKGRAAAVGPNTSEPIWQDTSRFFNRGTSGQWHHLLDEDGQRRYAARVAELADTDFSAWVHQGPVA
jgi:aryl sulfotransferase